MIRSPCPSPTVLDYSKFLPLRWLRWLASSKQSWWRIPNELVLLAPRNTVNWGLGSHKVKVKLQQLHSLWWLLQPTLRWSGKSQMGRMSRVIQAGISNLYISHSIIAYQKFQSQFNNLGHLGRTEFGGNCGHPEEPPAAASHDEGTLTCYKFVFDRCHMNHNKPCFWAYMSLKRLFVKQISFGQVPIPMTNWCSFRWPTQACLLFITWQNKVRNCSLPLSNRSVGLNNIAQKYGRCWGEWSLGI